MKRRQKEPSVPLERNETIRRNIIALLEGNTLSPREISVDVRISEREVYEHLEHIQRSVLKSGHSFIVHPPECRKCGFVFRKREKLKKPGRCPVCRNESITEPFFAIRSNK
jgi:predicted Zn-ribbon and HTH transcriptional regulator